MRSPITNQILKAVSRTITYNSVLDIVQGYPDLYLIVRAAPELRVDYLLLGAYTTAGLESGRLRSR